jgi:nickel-dependent lactate racemase
MPEHTLQIPLGRKTVPWTPPWDVVIPRPRGERPPSGTREDALAAPFGSPRLSSLASGAGTIAIVLPDATRLWQDVPRMARALREEVGEGKAAVTWIIGAGLHRAPTEEEKNLLLGGASRPGDTILWADPARAAGTGMVTSRGTPVTVAPEALGADLLVLAGGIVYHDLAGFSGGRKGLLPGISGRISVQNNHGLSLRGGIEGLEVNVGRLSGNATAEDMEEYGRLLEKGRTIFLLNVVPDETGKPSCYTAGSLDEAWRRGVEMARALQTLHIPGKAALAVVSSGGYPYDIDLYQATKAVTASLGALAPGGGLILCAGLEDGLGPGNFASDLPLALSDPGALLRRLEDDFTIPGFIALKVPHDMKGHPAALVTEREGTPFPGETFTSFDAAMEWMLPRIPHGPVVYVKSGNCIVLPADSE